MAPCRQVLRHATPISGSGSTSQFHPNEPQEQTEGVLSFTVDTPSYGQPQTQSSFGVFTSSSGSSHVQQPNTFRSGIPSSLFGMPKNTTATKNDLATVNSRSLPCDAIYTQKIEKSNTENSSCALHLKPNGFKGTPVSSEATLSSSISSTQLHVQQSLKRPILKPVRRHFSSRKTATISTAYNDDKQFDRHIQPLSRSNSKPSASNPIFPDGAKIYIAAAKKEKTDASPSVHLIFGKSEFEVDFSSKKLTLASKTSGTECPSKTVVTISSPLVSSSTDNALQNPKREQIQNRKPDTAKISETGVTIFSRLLSPGNDNAVQNPKREQIQNRKPDTTRAYSSSKIEKWREWTVPFKDSEACTTSAGTPAVPLRCGEAVQVLKTSCATPSSSSNSRNKVFSPSVSSTTCRSNPKLKTDYRVNERPDDWSSAKVSSSTSPTGSIPSSPWTINETSPKPKAELNVRTRSDVAQTAPPVSSSRGRTEEGLKTSWSTTSFSPSSFTTEKPFHETEFNLSTRSRISQDHKAEMNSSTATKSSSPDTGVKWGSWAGSFAATPPRTTSVVTSAPSFNFGNWSSSTAPSFLPSPGSSISCPLVSSTSDESNLKNYVHSNMKEKFDALKPNSSPMNGKFSSSKVSSSTSVDSSTISSPLVSSTTEETAPNFIVDNNIKANLFSTSIVEKQGSLGGPFFTQAPKNISATNPEDRLKSQPIPKSNAQCSGYNNLATSNSSTASNNGAKTIPFPFQCADLKKVDSSTSIPTSSSVKCSATECKVSMSSPRVTPASQSSVFWFGGEQTSTTSGVSNFKSDTLSPSSASFGDSAKTKTQEPLFDDSCKLAEALISTSGTKTSKKHGSSFHSPPTTAAAGNPSGNLPVTTSSRAYNFEAHLISSTCDISSSPSATMTTPSSSTYIYSADLKKVGSSTSTLTTSSSVKCSATECKVSMSSPRVTTASQSSVYWFGGEQTSATSGVLNFKSEILSPSSTSFGDSNKTKTQETLFNDLCQLAEALISTSGTKTSNKHGSSFQSPSATAATGDLPAPSASSSPIFEDHLTSTVIDTLGSPTITTTAPSMSSSPSASTAVPLQTTTTNESDSSATSVAAASFASLSSTCASVTTTTATSRVDLTTAAEAASTPETCANEAVPSSPSASTPETCANEAVPSSPSASTPETCKNEAVPSSPSASTPETCANEDVPSSPSASKAEVMKSPDRNPNADAAEASKEKGNAQFKLEKYDEALFHYSEAIKLCPNSACFHGNRAACYLMMGLYGKALEDSKKSIDIDPNFVKGYVRLAKCYIAYGDTASAEKTLREAEKKKPNNTALQVEKCKLEDLKNFIAKANKAYERSDYKTVVYNTDRAFSYASQSSTLKLLKAECLAYLNQVEEAQVLVDDVIRLDGENDDANFIRGLCMYNINDFDRALPYFQKALQSNPNHLKSKDLYEEAKLRIQKAKSQKLKEAGNAAYRAGNLAEAHKLYTDALAASPVSNVANAILFSNRATVSQKLGKFEDAIEDCTEALKLDNNYLKPLLMRAHCYQKLNDHEEAVADFEEAYKQKQTIENKTLLEEAKLILKQTKRKDYYKILGIDRKASFDEIKKAYKKKALEHHPDRHASSSDVKKRIQEKKFKDVGEAYGVLSNHIKRSDYDKRAKDDAFSGANANSKKDSHGFQRDMPKTSPNYSEAFTGSRTFNRAPPPPPPKRPPNTSFTKTSFEDFFSFPKGEPKASSNYSDGFSYNSYRSKFTESNNAQNTRKNFSGWDFSREQSPDSSCSRERAPSWGYYNSELSNMSNKSQKHRDFVSQPQRGKPVEVLPGIGEVRGRRLRSHGYYTVDQVLEKFRSFNESRSNFKSWMDGICGPNERWFNACYQCIVDYCDNY